MKTRHAGAAESYERVCVSQREEPFAVPDLRSWRRGALIQERSGRVLKTFGAFTVPGAGEETDRTC
jgi:hypothetical protein